MRVTFTTTFDNKIGKIDISQSIDNLQSTNGNVGTGQAYGLILNSSIRLGFVNLPISIVDWRVDPAGIRVR